MQSQPGWCELVYRSKAAELLLYGRALGLSHTEAEDVLQETFMALMKLPAVPDEPIHYTLRAFRNRALTYKRSLWRRLARELESRRWFERTPEETPAERRAMRSLAQLPREQREVIVLKIWHNYTFEEISQLTGVPPNTAAGRYRYGIQKLRNACCGKEQYEPGTPIDEATSLMEAASPFPQP